MTYFMEWMSSALVASSPSLHACCDACDRAVLRLLISTYPWAYVCIVLGVIIVQLSYHRCLLPLIQLQLAPLPSLAVRWQQRHSEFQSQWGRNAKRYESRDRGDSRCCVVRIVLPRGLTVVASYVSSRYPAFHLGLSQVAAVSTSLVNAFAQLAETRSVFVSYWATAAAWVATLLRNTTWIKQRTKSVLWLLRFCLD